MNQRRAKVPTGASFSLDTGWEPAVLCSVFVLSIMGCNCVGSSVHLGSLGKPD